MKSTNNIPSKMKALYGIKPLPEEALADPQAIARCVQLRDVDVPKPGHGQVLIKVSRGTLNPNDLYHAKGIYAGTKNIVFPRPLGFEGAGIVVAAGGGLISKLRMGKRVAFYSLGAFGEYALCKALEVFEIPEHVDFSTAACSVVNPMTALMILREARDSGSPYVINTAAASALGKLLLRHSQKYGVRVICIVRREEQVAHCKKEGATHVLNSSAPGFDAQLKRICADTGCRVAFDCTAGDMPARLLNALPDDGVVKIYGHMTPGPIQLMPQSLYPQRALENFQTLACLRKLSLASKALTARSISKGMGTDFKSEVQRSFSLLEAAEAYSYYSQNMSEGKVQIVANEKL